MKALQGQTVIDMAIQACGSLEAAYDLAVANGVSITDTVSGNMTSVDVVKQTIADYYSNKGLHPSSISAYSDSDDGIFTEQFAEQFT